MAYVDTRDTSRPAASADLPEQVISELPAAAVAAPSMHNTQPWRFRVRRASHSIELYADPAYRAELALWAGGVRDRDGMPDSALGPRSPDSPTPVRDFTPERAGPPSHAWFEESPQLAVLSVPSGGKADWLRAGQALQRVLLTATDRGIAASPLTQPLETADAWLVRDPRAGTEQPQMILRIGYGLTVPPAPRRPVSEVLDESQPGRGSQGSTAGRLRIGE